MVNTEDIIDFTTNQTSMTLLWKEKENIVTNKKELLYQYKDYVYSEVE